MIKKILKYLGRVFTYTLLTILIVFGLSLLFVFVTSKVANAKGQYPPINLFTIISPSMTPNINVYDVVVAVKTDPSKINGGDVISFYSSNPNVKGMTITHRVTQVTQNGSVFSFRTKGDFNKTVDSEVIYQDKIVGKVYFKIPQLGRVQFFLGSKGGWLIAILIPALAIISYDIYKIIKLIIVKQKILSYKGADKEVKAEIASEPMVSDIIKEQINEVQNNEITPLSPTAFEQSVAPEQTQSEIKTETDNLEITPLPEQKMEEIILEQPPMEQTVPMEAVEINPTEQSQESFVLEPEEIKIEEIFEEEKQPEIQEVSKDETEEIIVISD